MKDAPSRLLNETFFTDGLQVKLHRHVLDQAFKLHWHEFYELTFVISGTGTNTVNGVRQAIQPGDAFLLTPADFHEIAPDPGNSLDHFNLIFSQVMLSDDMVRFIFSKKIGRYARFDQPQDYAAIVFRFESMLAECTAHAAGRHIAAQSELNRILIEWHRHRQAMEHGQPDKPADSALANKHGTQQNVDQRVSLRQANHHHPGIQKSLIYIQHHFRQPISLQDAANHAHLSTNYFSELFRKSTGITFQQYLQQLRLQFAQSLLQTSSLPITEVSYVSGFNTLTHFERVFRVHFGMTPSEAQKQGAGQR